MHHHTFMKGRYTVQMKNVRKLFENDYAKKSVGLFISLTPSSMMGGEEILPPQKITRDWDFMYI